MQFRVPRIIFGNNVLTNHATVPDDPKPDAPVVTICSVDLSESNPMRVVIVCKGDGLTAPSPTNSPQPSQTLSNAERSGIFIDVIIFCALICIILLAMIGACTVYFSRRAEEKANCRRQRHIVNEQQDQQGETHCEIELEIELDMFELEAR